MDMTESQIRKKAIDLYHQIEKGQIKDFRLDMKNKIKVGSITLLY